MRGVNPSPRSIGIVMMVFALFVPLLGLHYGAAPTASSLAVSAALVLGGVAMVLRRPFSFWVALGAGAITTAGGVASYLLHRPIGLGLTPLVSVVIGLYLCFRVVIARPALGAQPEKRRIADDLPGDPH